MMEKKQIRSIFSRIGFAMLLFFVLGNLVLPVVIEIVVSMVAPQLFESSFYVWASVYIPMYFVAFPLMLLITRTIPNSKPVAPKQEKLPVKTVLLLIAASMGMVLGLNYLGMGMAHIVALLRGTDTAVNGLAVASSNSNVWFNLFIVGIVAPVMEEILFRGILFKKLIRFGGATYCIVSAMLFALLHANFYQLLYAFVLGLIFGYVVYIDGGRLRYALLLHLTMNILGNGGSMVLGTYLPETAFMIYNIFLLLLAAVGIVVTVIWLIKGRKNVSFAPAEVALPSKGVTVANVGMILYILATMSIVVFQLFVF